MENGKEFQEQEQEQEINLKDYLQVLLRRKYIILLVFAASLPFIFIQAFSGAPLFRASAKLLIERNMTPAFITEHRPFFDPNYLLTQTQIIKSKKVGRQVVEQLNLDETYHKYFPGKDSGLSMMNNVLQWFRNLYKVGFRLAGLGRQPAPTGEVGAFPLTEEEKKEMRIDSLARMISAGIQVERGSRDGGNVIHIAFVSTHPVLSANIVNAVADAYRRFLLEMRTTSTAESVEYLEKKAAGQREKLQASERILQQYKRDQGIFLLNNQEALLPGRLSTLSARLTKVQAEVGEMESLYREISRISLSEALNLPDVASSPTVSSLRRQMVEQEQAINNLSRSIGDKHPRMIRAREDLQSLRNKLDEEVQGVIQSIRNRYELARDQAVSIEAMLEETKQDAGHINDKMIQYQILKRDVDVNALLYDRMLRRIKEYDVTEASQPIEVWVVEEAAVPRFPFNQRPKRALMLGLMVSLMIGVGLAFFMEYLDNTVKTVEDAEAKLNLPILGMIPYVEDASNTVELVVYESPQSVISENYKSLRTAVLLSSVGGSPRSLLITSMNPRTGKTVTSCNLAVAFAQTDRRVLLIDADMRRPRIHSIFGIENASGLSTLLSGQSVSTLLSGQSDSFVVDIPDFTCLHVMPSGPTPPNPSELLISSRMEKALKLLCDNYDCIIIDSPPILNVTDAMLLSKMVDQTLLVIRSGVSTYASLRRGEKMLAAIKSNVLGYLINGVDAKRERQYYYKYYGEHYSEYSSNKS